MQNERNLLLLINTVAILPCVHFLERGKVYKTVVGAAMLPKWERRRRHFRESKIKASRKREEKGAKQPAGKISECSVRSQESKTV